MNTLAAPVSKAVSLPGADFGRTALLIESTATQKQLSLIGSFLHDVKDSLGWWQSDYVGAMAQRHSHLPDKGMTICSEHGLEQSSFDFYLSVSAIFPPDLRIEALSFEHHKEALILTNHDPKLARQWLAKALKEEWDVPTLRKNIRQSLATYHPDARPPTGNGYSSLLDAERWAKTQSKDLPTYTPDRAKAILSDISALRSLIDTLESIADTGV